MQITRTEVETVSPNKTPRKEIVPLNTGPREVEPELIGPDFSESEDWPWNSDPSKNTWDIQIEAVRQFIAPFEALDSPMVATCFACQPSREGTMAAPVPIPTFPVESILIVSFMATDVPIGTV